MLPTAREVCAHSRRDGERHTQEREGKEEKAEESERGEVGGKGGTDVGEEEAAEEDGEEDGGEEGGRGEEDMQTDSTEGKGDFNVREQVERHVCCDVYSDTSF